MGSQSSRDQNQNLEGLFKCPWFYGELSREDATETLNEAGKNVGESWPKDILFLETVSDDFGQNRFALIAAFRKKGQPLITFTEISCSLLFRYWIREHFTYDVVRKKPFSLEVLAAVKVASCGFNLETLELPRMIKKEVKKFQDLIKAIQSLKHY